MQVTAATALVLLAALPAAAVDLPCWGAVTGDHVRVRSGPDVQFRPMCSIDKGAVVRVIEASDDGKWLRLVPPPEADVYVFAKFVEVKKTEGTLTADRVNVRVRPSLTGELVHRVNTGDKVVVKARVKGDDGDWLRIAPPVGVRAWISAAFVRRMTDSDMIDFQKKQEALAKAEADRKQKEAEQAQLEARRRKQEADRLARLQEAEQKRKEAEQRWRDAEAKRKEAERQKVEAERKRQDAERALHLAEQKQKEALLFAKVNDVFTEELTKPVTDRSLDRVVKAYETALGALRDSGLVARARARLAVARHMKEIAEAIAKKQAPKPIGDLDLETDGKRLGMQREIDALRADHKLARDVARAAGADVSAGPTDPGSFVGWVFYLGAGLQRTGATHRLVRNGKVIALIRSRQYDLGTFVGSRVRVKGEPSGTAALSTGEGKVPILLVNQLEQLD